MAEEIASLVDAELSAKKLAWQLGIAEDRHFQGEPVLLRRALLNLVQNAIQASPEGGPLRLGFERREGSVCWLVEDGGPGVPDDKREEVFKPFFTTRQKGTGLGLAFVRKIAEAHGGVVRVDRSSLGGACFELKLPERVVAVVRS